MAKKKVQPDYKVKLLLTLLLLEATLFFYPYPTGILAHPRAVYVTGAALIATILLLGYYTLPTPAKKSRKK